MQLAGSRKVPGLSNAAGGRKAVVLAVMLGLVAAVLSWNFVQKAGQGSRRVASVPVLVAAVDIPVRTQVSPEMLTVKEIATDARHPLALTGVEQAVGKFSNLPISAGEQVLQTKFFQRPEDAGLAFRIPPGKRAVSVSVSEVISTGGLIVPGDFVDVVSILPPQATTDGRSANAPANAPVNPDDLQETATIILQNIEVLAVAQSLGGVAPQQKKSGVGALNGNAPPPDTKQEVVARPDARTISLAVAPDEGQKLILAEAKGQIRLALRAMDDHETVPVAPTRLRDVRR